MPRIRTDQYQDDFEDEYEDDDAEGQVRQSSKLSRNQRRDLQDWEEQRREHWLRRYGEK